MSHPMLPNSTAGLPKTNAERMVQPAAQPAALYGLTQGEEKEDEPGEEMARDARVWKTYVREADARDKEMVDGRNSSLDVLLIFAALFSAISTAFIVESLGDLKPDPAESAVQVQRAMLETQQGILQALAAIANGQPFSLPPAQSDSEDSPPTRSTVAVNVLWLLSLALSVAVTLIAMLAKGWCYKFLSGRNGPLCEQSRRRGQKWDGIERWKMEEVLECLPGAMHLALLLFAIGLCIHLWGIHIAAAVSVTVVTSIVMCGYSVVTVLPIVHQYCPYSTPVTPALQWFLSHPVLQAVRFFCHPSSAFDVPSVWDRFASWILGHCAARPSHASVDNQVVPMDETTARMLAWLITTCDDSRSVDFALQAIAGASSRLPCAPLLTCRAHELLRSRLSAYRERPLKLGELHMESLTATLRYFRSYVMLLTDDVESCLDTSEAQAARHRDLVRIGADEMKLCYWSIFERSSDTMSEGAKAKLLLAASCTKWVAELKRLDIQADVWFYGWPDDYSVQPTISTLHQYRLSDSYVDSAAVSYALYSVSSYIAHCNLVECHGLGSLYGSLARLCLVSDGPDTPLSHMSPVPLAVAAFMLCSYPGGEQPSRSDRAARCKRALQVIDHYRSSEPSSSEAAALFAFGFIAIAHLLQPATFDNHEIRGKVLPLVFEGISWLNSTITVHSFPDHCFFDAHLGVPVKPQPEEQVVLGEQVGTLSWLHVLQNRCGLDLSDPWLYVPALATLYTTGSGRLQELCTAILDSQPALAKVDILLLHVSQEYANRGLICRQQADTDASVASTTLFYLRLIVAYIMLCPTIPLTERRQALGQLKDHYQRISLENVEPLEHDDSMPTSNVIFAHVAEDTDQQNKLDCMRQTMQLLANFCNASSSDTDPQPAYSDWADRLHVIRCSRRPNVPAIAGGGTAGTESVAIRNASDTVIVKCRRGSTGLLIEQTLGNGGIGVGDMLLTGDGTAWE